MTYDPYQAYATPGGYAGIGNPFQTPFNTMQNPGINSGTGWNSLAAYQTQPAYLQNPLVPAGLQQSGLQQAGLQAGFSPHSLLQQLAAQQLAQQIVAQHLAAQQIASQQNPYGQPFGLQPSPFNQQGLTHLQAGQIGFGGQGISPFGQPGSPFNQTGVPLAPQSWVGQAGQLGFGQNNPMLVAQLTARALQAQGIAPGQATRAEARVKKHEDETRACRSIRFGTPRK